MTAVVIAGLSDAEVAQRVAEGKANDVPTRAARSVSEIVRANVLTRINAILGVLFLIVLATGSLINGLFGLLIVANSAIGIIQELRAKPSIAGNSLTRHCLRASRTTPTANAIEVISTRPSGTIGTSAPTIRRTDSRQPASVVNSWV